MVFGKLEELSGIADDTFVYGIGEAEHDQRILNVLETASSEREQCEIQARQISVQGKQSILLRSHMNS